MLFKCEENRLCVEWHKMAHATCDKGLQDIAYVKRSQDKTVEDHSCGCVIGFHLLAHAKRTSLFLPLIPAIAFSPEHLHSHTDKPEGSSAFVVEEETIRVCSTVSEQAVSKRLNVCLHNLMHKFKGEGEKAF